MVNITNVDNRPLYTPVKPSAEAKGDRTAAINEAEARQRVFAEKRQNRDRRDHSRREKQVFERRTGNRRRGSLRIDV